jgi:hypothetical protein
MKNLLPEEAKDRYFALSETRRHLKIIKGLKNERKEIQKPMVLDIDKSLSQMS